MTDRPTSPAAPTSGSLLIRQAEIVLPGGDRLRGDVWVRGDRIHQIAPEIDPTTIEDLQDTIEAAGLTLLPGAIDPQVHFREPGLEYKEDLSTASQACAKGGITSFLEMPNTKPLTTTQARLDEKLALAASKCVVNYGFFIGATADVLPDLLTAQPACGIKIFMGSMHGPLLVDEEPILDRLFSQGQTADSGPGRLIAVHAEHQARIAQRREALAGRSEPHLHSLIQDNQAALEATQLALALSKRHHRRLHILHMSTGEEAELMRVDKPAWVTCEVTPQHLLLDISAYEKIGSLAQMNPPLRSPEDCQTLWRALLDGAIDFIATDHAPHLLSEKAQAYPASPSGMPGVETSLPLMLTQAAQGRCMIDQVVAWMSSNVAQAYGIAHKGSIVPGYDADLVLVDLNQYRPVLREELLSKCGWSPFEGWSLTGWPVVTIVGGQVVYDRRAGQPGQVNTQVRGRALQFTP